MILVESVWNTLVAIFGAPWSPWWSIIISILMIPFIHILSIHIWIHWLICMRIYAWIHKNYCHIWIHLWIHICKYEFTYKTLLVPPISYVFFHKFINSYMYSWFSMNTCLKWWYESICKPFWHPWFNIFNEFIPDVMDFGPFSWKRSYSKSCLKNIEKQKVKSIVISCKLFFFSCVGPCSIMDRQWEKYCQMEQKTSLKCIKQTWFELVWIQNLKIPLFYCLNHHHQT